MTWIRVSLIGSVFLKFCKVPLFSAKHWLNVAN